MFEEHLGEDAPRRVAGAEKEDIVGFRRHPRLLSGAAGGSAAGLCGGLLGRSLDEGRLAAQGALARLPELGERSLAIYRGLAVGEKRLPGHALRVANPLLVGLGITAGGALRFDDRPLGPTQSFVDLRELPSSSA